MKKLIALSLVVILFLGMVACGAAPEDERIAENRELLAHADALMAEGRYEDALVAYSSIPFYNEVAANIETARKKAVAEKIALYVGTWMDIHSSTVLTVSEEGSVRITDSYGTDYESTAWPEGDTVYIYSDTVLTEIDGIPHLKGEWNDFVPEENYEAIMEALAPKLVEITLENWETYFERREGSVAYVNESGEIASYVFGFQYCLRDEYEAKLANGMESVNVTFEVEYGYASYYVEGDYPNGEFYLGEQFFDPSAEYGRKIYTSKVYLIAYDENCITDFDGYCTTLSGGSINNGVYNGSKWVERYNAMVPNDPVLIAVSGTLELLP